MGKLTAAQRKLLKEIQDGCELVGHFDVYGGYWWQVLPHDRAVKRDTVEGLVRAGVIVEGEMKRPHSGRRITEYKLAPLT